MGGVRSIAVLAGALALLLLPAPALGASDADRACAWLIEPSYDRANILFPEVTTTYLVAILPVPAGDSIEITGEYPHARYMSLQTYGGLLQSTSVQRDTDIDPDEGSQNPFIRGARRTGRHRSYTVRLVEGREPAGGPAPNTLYNTNAAGQTGRSLAYRIYLPDRGSGRYGGVKPPTLTRVAADGTRSPVPSCPDVVPDTSAVWRALSDVGLDVLPLPPAGLLAKRKTVWHRFVNAPTSITLGVLENEIFPDALVQAAASLAVLLPAGFGENADNKYVAGSLSHEFGKVALVSAKLPRTPRTLDGQRRMGGGQMRFWSLCTGWLTTQTHGCLVDEDIRPDEDGRFQIVISTKASRPPSATVDCGFGWLVWGPSPKVTAIMRNMLPKDSFEHSVQRAAVGQEKEAMGPYYPRVKYFATPEAFEEKHGC